jgi:hypothetical protein
MTGRFLAPVGIAVVIAFALLTPAGAAGQSATPAKAKTTAAARGYTPPRAPDGHPDLHGVWDFRNLIPLERPSQYAGKEFLTDAEAVEFAKLASQLLDMDRRDDDQTNAGTTALTVQAPSIVNGAPASADVARAYNDFWWDYGRNFVGRKRTSLIVDPPDGKIPRLTPEGQKRADEFAERRARAATGPEDRSVGERCIMGFNAGPPLLPGAYNNNMQLFQSSDHVVIVTEMVHNARIVPLDGRWHVSLRQWSGTSRGRWEGESLVVETRDFHDATSFPNSSPAMHLIEKFSRVDSDTLLYEFTVSDPTTWTKPFTAQIPMKRSDEQLYEYACHEGNYAMAGLLKAARAVERSAGGGSTQR